MDKATIKFFEDLEKEAARVAAPGVKRDFGIDSEASMTRKVNEGSYPTPALEKIENRQIRKEKQVIPNWEPSTWETKKVAKSLYEDPESNPVALVNDLRKRYQMDWLTWEPETLWETLEEEIHPIIKDKIMAIRVLMDSDGFWNEWEIFEKVCAAFNSREVNFTLMEDLSVGELALGVALSRKFKNQDFSDEVKAYIAAQAVEDGYARLPKQLDFAQEYLTNSVKDTPAEELVPKLENPEKIEVTDEENPLHVQAGLLQAIHSYVKDNDNVEVARSS